MSPPKTQNGDILEEPIVLERIRNDGFTAEMNSSTEKKKLLYFLYGREYYQ